MQDFKGRVAVVTDAMVRQQSPTVIIIKPSVVLAKKKAAEAALFNPYRNYFLTITEEP